MKLENLAVGLITAVVSLTPLPALSALICGPGDHWIDTCSGGTDSFNSAFHIDGHLVQALGALPIGTTFDGTLLGPTTVNRSNPLDDSAFFPGLRPTDSHFDVIDTEIISAQGQGNIIFHIPSDGDVVVAVTLRIGTGNGVATPSQGAIAETGNPAVGASFFDVFFEIDTPFGILFNRIPGTDNDVNDHHVVADVLCLTPDAINPNTGGQCVDFYLLDTAYDLYLQGVQNPAAIMESGIHDIIPEPGSVALLGLGLAGLGFSRRKRAS